MKFDDGETRIAMKVGENERVTKDREFYFLVVREST